MLKKLKPQIKLSKPSDTPVLEPVEGAIQTAPIALRPQIALPNEAENQTAAVPNTALKPQIMMPQTGINPSIDPQMELPPDILHPGAENDPNLKYDAPLVEAQNPALSSRPRLAPQLSIPPPVESEDAQIPEIDPAEAAAANTSLRPRLVGQTWDEHRKENRENLIKDPNLQSAVENKPSRLTAGIGLGLASIAAALRSGRPLGEALGEGLGSGIGGAIAPKVFADEQNRYQIGQIEETEKKAYEQQKRDLELDKTQTQIDEIKRKPEKEAADRQARNDLEALRHANRISAIVEQRKLKGMDTKIVTSKDGSGKLMTVDGNGKETPFLDPDSGEQLYNPQERPIEQDIPDGVNADGTPRYRKVFVKGSQALSAAAQRELANAQFKWGETRYNADNEEQFQANYRKWETDVATAGGDVSKYDGETVGLQNKTGQLDQNLRVALGNVEKVQGELSDLESDDSAITSAEKEAHQKAIAAKRADLKTVQSDVTRLQTDKTNADKDLQSKKGELQGAKDKWETLKKNPPKKAAAVSSPVVSGGGSGGVKPTQEMARQRWKSLGKSDEEIKSLMQQAISKGLVQ